MAKKIRVMMLIHSYFRQSFGGAEKQLRSLAPLLQERDVEMHVLSRRYPGLAAYENLDGTILYRTPYVKLPLVPALLFTLLGLLHIIRVRPDVLHVHGLFSTVSTGIMARRILGIPVVAKAMRGGILGDMARIREKGVGQRRIAQMRKYVDRFIVISEEIRTELVAAGISDERCHYIPNGVDTQLFKPVSPEQKRQKRQEFGLPPDSPTAVYVGRLIPAKRVYHLIESWRTVAQRFPDTQLLIVGQGADREALEAQAGPGIRFTGPVSNVPEWLQIADLFVLPSVSEGLSNSLLEAMASELPIIATAVGDAPNLIEPGVNGWLIPADDVSSLTDALLEAFGNLDQIRTMGAKSRARILSDFQLSVTSDKLRQVYDDVMRTPSTLS